MTTSMGERRLLESWVQSASPAVPFATTSLRSFDPALSRLLPGIDGLVVVPQETASGFVAWCRRGLQSWEEIKEADAAELDRWSESGSEIRAGDLQDGITNGELVLHYQPVVQISDGRVKGVEALVRWNSRDFGLVPPNEFIPLAETTGLIVPLGRWVIGEAIRQLGEWKSEGRVGADFGVAINLSPTQLTDVALLAVLDAACITAGVLPPDVMLEITESSLVAEGSDMFKTLEQLTGAGYLLSIDDFGTGQSSLSYLRYLPASQLKLDISFVAGVPSDARDVALVTALIGLAHDFGMTCVAEGIETAEQLACLSNLGCDLGQGYLLGRPLPVDQNDFLRQ